MSKAEFDEYAEQYAGIHSRNIAITGESPQFFHEYKVHDARNVASQHGLGDNLHILDFGSGIGNSIPYFKKYFPVSPLTCLDVSAKSLTVAQNEHPGVAEFKQYDGNVFPFDEGVFDLAFSACVFHHIPHESHAGLLQEMFRVLKPGGVIIIFEHNPLNPLTLRAVRTCEFDKNAVLVKTGKLKKCMAFASFSEVKSVYRVFFPRMLKRLRPLERLLGRVPLGAQYYVSAVKKSS